MIKNDNNFILYCPECDKNIDINKREYDKNANEDVFHCEICGVILEHNITPLKFKVNEFITLKLEGNITNIYINNIRFNQCRNLLINIEKDKIEDFDSFNSIDEIIEKNFSLVNDEIPPKIEFWGHCSNIHAWAENSYNTNIIDSKLAFPILKKLVDAGDPIAKRVFKEEIAIRFSSGFNPVQLFLIQEGFLEYLKKEELQTIIDDLNLEEKKYLFVRCWAGDEYIDDPFAIIDISVLKDFILEKRKIFQKIKANLDDSPNFLNITYLESSPMFIEPSSYSFLRDDDEYKYLRLYFPLESFKEERVDTVKLIIEENYFKWSFYFKNSEIQGSTYSINYKFLEGLEDKNSKCKANKNKR